MVVAVVAAFAVASLVDWTWQLPAATLPALLAAGSGRSLPRLGAGAGVALGVAALVLGVATAAHGVGAALVETGKRPALASRLLPYDARPWVSVAPARACRIDPGEPMLQRLAHPPEGCRLPRSKPMNEQWPPHAIALAVLAAVALLTLGAVVAVAAPDALGRAASPNAGAGRMEYCPRAREEPPHRRPEVRAEPRRGDTGGVLREAPEGQGPRRVRQGAAGAHQGAPEGHRQLRLM